MMITMLADAEGNEIPSMTESYFAWKEWFGKNNTPIHVTKKNGVCVFCGGWKELVTEQYGRMWCICAVEERTKILRLQNSEYRSLGLQEATFDNFQTWGELLQEDKLITMVDYLKEWAKFPKGWVTLIGPPGVGKSHMLSAINKELSPWALYITSADFESKAFRAQKGIADYNLEDMLNVISQTPILLFDDLGAEYGKEFIVSLIRHVFDFRYQRPTEYISVVTSNYDISTLNKNWDWRTSDRIHDKQIAKIIDLSSCMSWRRHDGNDK